MTERASAKKVMLKRAYESPAAEDGKRILVDRLWPRGVTKEGAGIDLWAKDLAPSTELRKWFAHDPARWPEFRKRYVAELHERQPQLEELRGSMRESPITLVYAARDEIHNHAIVLRDVLLDL